MATLHLTVLNPGGRDPDQDFGTGAGEPSGRSHPPVNYHGYAACTRGRFLRDTAKAIRAGRPVLLLLRGDLKASLDALRTLRHAELPVALALKEAGLHQIAHLLQDTGRAERFRACCALAGAAVASTPELVALFRAAGADLAEYIPTPYPVEEPDWDFTAPAEIRRGLAIGTREFDVPSRNHAAAIVLAARVARECGEPLGLVNLDGGAGTRRIRALAGDGVDCEIQQGRRAYPEYLRFLARHRLVFQLDRSAVPGQVAGDALLCRIPCVGGDGATERLLFPDLNGQGRTADDLAEILRRLLRDPAETAAHAQRAAWIAAGQLGFAAVAERLVDFFAEVGRRPRGAHR